MRADVSDIPQIDLFAPNEVATSGERGYYAPVRTFPGEQTQGTPPPFAPLSKAVEEVFESVAEVVAERVAEAIVEPLAAEPEAPAEPFLDPMQETLFDMRPPWLLEWGGMPEFSQEDLTPARSLLVHFETIEDVKKFEELVRQPIGPHVKSVWYPEAEICRMSDKRYADER